jgi:hypothetical protein
MRLTVNYRDKEIADKIMQWLFIEEEISGYEPDLLGEKLSDLLAPSEITKLEIWLGNQFDGTIDLPKDLVFISI